MKASFIAYPRRTHKYKKLGIVVIHDDKSKITFNEFDSRYKGKKSRFGAFLRDLQAKGIDISSIARDGLESDNHELILVMSQRLYSALGKRTKIRPCSCNTFKGSLKNDESFDIKNPGIVNCRYYKMAARIFSENDQETAIRIINIITGYS